MLEVRVCCETEKSINALGNYSTCINNFLDVFFFLIEILSVRFIISEIGCCYTSCQKILFVNVTHILEEIRIPQIRGVNS